MATNEQKSQRDDKADADTGRAPPRKMPFTDVAVKRLKVPSSGQSVVWDEKQPGLSILLSSGGPTKPNGTRTYRCTFGVAGRWYTTKLGRVGELDLAEARKRTAKWRAMAADGVDPRESKVDRKTEKVTYAEVVDRFITEWAQPRQRTWRDTKRILLSFTDWHDRAFSDITKAEARTILRGYVNAGQKYKAAAAVAWVRKLWRWGAEEDLVPAPIMDLLGIHIERVSRDRWFNDGELKALWHAADRCADPVKGAYFKLLLLLAPRKVALANMTWEDIKDGVWVTPFEFTKSRKSSVRKRTYHTPLPPLALRILAGLSKSNERVFPTIPTEPAERFSKELIVNGAPGDFTYHAVRHSVATWLQNNGASEYEIGLILNHAGTGVTAGYSHGIPMKLKLELLTRWSDHVESLVTPTGAALLR